MAVNRNLGRVRTTFLPFCTPFQTPTPLIAVAPLKLLSRDTIVALSVISCKWLLVVPPYPPPRDLDLKLGQSMYVKPDFELCLILYHLSEIDVCF